MEDIFEDAFKAIFQVLFNFIGASIRWLFFFGTVSFGRLESQKTKNILVGIVFWLLLIAGGLYWAITR